MLRFTRMLIFFACVASAMASCSSSSPDKVSFHGVWNYSLTTLLADEKVNYIVDTDGKRFRIETDSLIQVYDGKKLYTKFKAYPHENNMYGEPVEEMDFAGGDTGSYYDAGEEEITEVKAKQMIFWARYLGKKTGPGGLVAGRETVLYAAAENRPDGKLTAQWWVDGKTGIVLKELSSIYSKQVSETIHKESWECESIDFRPMDESLFSKPI